MAPKSKSLWHPFWEKCHVSWKNTFPQSEYQHILWDHAKIDQFIEDKFPNCINFYYSLPFHVMQLDFARYCILYEYGGIYADMDVYCFKNFYEVIDKEIFFVQSPFQKEIVQNCLFGSEKGSEYILDIIHQIQKTFYYYELVTDPYSEFYRDYVLTISGPILLSNYYSSLSEKDKNKFQILEKDKFNPNSIDQFKNLDLNCIHILTGLWGQDHIKNLLQVSNLNNMSYSDYIKNEYKKERSQIYELMEQFLL